MKVDDPQLLAYVDGGLQPNERASVDAQLRESEKLRKKVALLRASRVDFAEAFAHQELPPVPESLRRKIDDMLHEHRTGQGGQEADAGPAPSSPPGARQQSLDMPVWLAAACIACAFMFGQFTRIDSVSRNTLDTRVFGGEPRASNVDASPWVTAAVGYQKLFTRETIAYASADGSIELEIVRDIRDEDKLPLRVPDLRSAGLTFKAVQRLRFDNKPLVQIVYLPRNGPPIALCVMEDAQRDEPVATRTVGTMNVALWRQEELAYALIGDPRGVDLTELGNRISNHEAPPLFTES
ncbi:anti-sigma factor family protein [Paraburkholderia strydomiana]|uniref:anti-sigma factor family protein n=1 Tax=Paraburkholderia strydomiana TaxID=1245417 RepID=UPI001BE50A64|nr:anti-sigma factor [Paraburkholderia strydomiana]MBT2790064.1 anti-sigma factor [Paraburkholderia strydomiana]